MIAVAAPPQVVTYRSLVREPGYCSLTTRSSGLTPGKRGLSPSIEKRSAACTILGALPVSLYPLAASSASAECWSLRLGSMRVDILRRFRRLSQSSSSSSALSPSESKATRSLSVAGERMRLRPFAGGARKPFSSEEVKGLLLARERPLAGLGVPLATIDDVEGRGELLVPVARLPFTGVLGFLGTSTLTVRIFGFGSVFGVNLGCLENILTEVSTSWLAGR